MPAPIITAPTLISFNAKILFSTEATPATQIRVQGATSINVEGIWHDDFHRLINGDTVEIRGTSEELRNDNTWVITASNADGTSIHTINYEVVHVPIIIPDITSFQISRHIEVDHLIPIVGIPTEGYIEGELLGLETEVALANNPDEPTGIRIVGMPVDNAGIVDGTYTFKVIAGNTAGNREKTGSFELVSIRLPDAPANVMVDTDDSTITLTWEASPNDGGSPITDYEVRINQEDWISKGLAGRTHTFSNLSNGVSYEVSVRSVTAWGGSEPVSFTTTPMIIPVLPSAPTNVLTHVSSQQIILQWSTPASDGGTAITNYEVRIGSGSWISRDAGARSHTFTGLSTGRNYTVRVRARNSVGVSPSVSRSVRTLAAPSVPRNITATAGNSQIVLRWDAPSSNGGSSITSYEVQVGNNNWIALASTARTHTFTGLNNGTTYTVRVRARNNVGYSPAGTATATPATVPGAPFLWRVQGSHASGSMIISWEAPNSDGGSPITNYEYRYSWVDASTGITLNRIWVSYSRIFFEADEITGLLPNTVYTFQVRAVNAVGTGPASNSLSGTSTA